MKGIIFQLLEQVVTDAQGADAWDDLLSDTGLDGVYTSLGNYPDADLVALVEAASEKVGMPANDLVRWFGRAAVPLLAEAHPQFFAPFSSTTPFLLTINDVIHAEVRKLYPDADVPEFEFGTASEGRLALAYQSPRRLCALAEGFIDGAADHFGEQVTIEQSACMLRGDERCVIVCSFAPRLVAEPVPSG